MHTFRQVDAGDKVCNYMERVATRCDVAQKTMGGAVPFRRWPRGNGIIGGNRLARCRGVLGRKAILLLRKIIGVSRCKHDFRRV